MHILCILGATCSTTGLWAMSCVTRSPAPISTAPTRCGSACRATYL